VRFPAARVFRPPVSIEDLKTDTECDPEGAEEFIALIQSLRNDRLFEGATVAAKVWGWLQTGVAGILVVGTSTLLSQLAFPLLLFALIREESGRVVADQRTALFLRRAAQVAVLVGGLALVLNVVQQVYAAVSFKRNCMAGN
jgi:hypothetical protein